MMSNLKKLTYLSILLAIGIVLNLIENFFIPPVTFGIRFGIANIISLLVVENYDIKTMWLLNILRVIIANLLTASLFGPRFLISIGGIILSSIILSILAHSKSSDIFMSIMSSIAHSVGQVLVVVILYKQQSMLVFIPILLLSSLPTGILTGIIAMQVNRRIEIGEKK